MDWICKKNNKKLEINDEMQFSVKKYNFIEKTTYFT